MLQIWVSLNLLVYGMSQSFLLKLDQFSSLAFVWGLLLLTSTDLNACGSEFGSNDKENPSCLNTSFDPTDDFHNTPSEGYPPGSL